MDRCEVGDVDQVHSSYVLAVFAPLLAVSAPPGHGFGVWGLLFPCGVY